MIDPKIKSLAKDNTLDELLEAVKFKYDEIFTWIPEKYRKFDPEYNENPFFSSSDIKTDLKLEVKNLDKFGLVNPPLIDKIPSEKDMDVCRKNAIQNLTKYYKNIVSDLEKENGILKQQIKQDSLEES